MPARGRLLSAGVSFLCHLCIKTDWRWVSRIRYNRWRTEIRHYRRHCLVYLLNRRSFIEGLVRSLEVIVMNKHCKPLADAPPTAHPRRMEAVNSHLERVKPLFDVVSVDILKLTAQP